MPCRSSARFVSWSAANLLILYFIDTLLAVGVIAAGFLSRLSG